MNFSQVRRPLIILLCTTFVVLSTKYVQSKADLNELILTESSLGPLNLDKKTNISKKKLEKLFPEYNVSYQIGSGDSQDFHYFEIKTKTKELLFTISSFLEYVNYEKKIIKNPEDIRIDILSIYSPKIRDEYGIKVGDGYRKVLEKRGKNLNFNPMHHDIGVGSGNVHYNIDIPVGGPNEPDRDPATVTKDEIIKCDCKVNSISWPNSKW